VAPTVASGLGDVLARLRAALPAAVAAAQAAAQALQAPSTARSGLQAAPGSLPVADPGRLTLANAGLLTLADPGLLAPRLEPWDAYRWLLLAAMNHRPPRVRAPGPRADASARRCEMCGRLLEHSAFGMLVCPTC
jgi:hypothetical protein